MEGSEGAGINHQSPSGDIVLLCGVFNCPVDEDGTYTPFFHRGARKQTNERKSIFIFTNVSSFPFILTLTHFFFSLLICISLLYSSRVHINSMVERFQIYTIFESIISGNKKWTKKSQPSIVRKSEIGKSKNKIKKRESAIDSLYE